ncbi:30S ribosomal protein S20 [candidate division WOR-3 bacterium]|nr:30S ribosomal protein S20 [candidate division WOR-3 bacterium]
MSVLKRERQTARRRLRNVKRRKQLRASLKQIRATEDKEAAGKLLPEVQSVIDKSARNNIIHRNTARRLKSRLAKQVAKQG